MRIFKIALLLVFAASTVLGAAGSASASTTTSCTTGGFRDDRPSNGFFTYGPDWTHYSNYGGFGPHPSEPLEETTSVTDKPGTVMHWGPTAGAWGTVVFDITCREAFDYIYARADNRGIVNIYARTNSGWRLTPIKRVDLYSPTIQWQFITRVPLPAGTIQVAIVNSGDKNVNSKGTYMDLDGITPR